MMMAPAVNKKETWRGLISALTTKCFKFRLTQHAKVVPALLRPGLANFEP